MYFGAIFSWFEKIISNGIIKFFLKSLQYTIFVLPLKIALDSYSPFYNEIDLFPPLVILFVGVVIYLLIDPAVRAISGEAFPIEHKSNFKDLLGKGESALDRVIKSILTRASDFKNDIH